MTFEDSLKQQLQDLQNRLSRKRSFEEAVFSIESLFRDNYSTASPNLQKSFFSAISRVAAILRTRYTAPGFWRAGLRLFQHAETLLEDPSQKERLKRYISSAHELLNKLETESDGTQSTSDQRNRGYLFEGHLTVDPEPPQPDWLVQSNILASAAALFSPASHQDDVNNMPETAAVLEELISTFESIVPQISDDDMPKKAPPASKKVVAKLPVLVLTEDASDKIGVEAECAICKENFVVGDEMQGLPCGHTFHPSCVKTWLDKHNSCPICRHELPTDDHAYESWKEREKEAEEERRGAANAVRGGEFMYV